MDNEDRLIEQYKDINEFIISFFGTDKYFVSNEKWSEFRVECKSLFDEIENHGQGISFWMDDFPILNELMEKHLDNDFARFNNIMLPNMKEVYLDFKQLEEDTKRIQPEIFDEELNDSKDKMFKTQECSGKLYDTKNKLVLLRLTEIKNKIEPLNESLFDSFIISQNNVKNVSNLLVKPIDYEYTSNMEGTPIILTRRKNGKWYYKGYKTPRGGGFYIGHRRYYQDPHF